MNNHYDIFNDFEKPRATIDFISISRSSFIPSPEVAATRLEAIKATGARLEWSKKSSDNWESNFLTFHDATPATISYLVTEHGNIEVRDIEISLDYFLKDGSNDPVRLRALYDHLIHCLNPRHDLIRKVNIGIGDDKGRYVRDTLKTKATGRTVIWEHVFKSFKVRLYIKTKDNDIEIERHSVRLEVTLYQQELANRFNPSSDVEGIVGILSAGRFRLHMLPRLIDSLRTYLSGFLNIGEGIAPTLTRTRATGLKAERVNEANETEQQRVIDLWTTYGAIWAERHDHRVKPNKSANDDIGRALTELQRKLKRAITKINCQTFRANGASTTGLYTIRKRAFT